MNVQRTGQYQKTPLSQAGAAIAGILATRLSHHLLLDKRRYCLSKFKYSYTVNYISSGKLQVLKFFHKWAIVLYILRMSCPLPGVDTPIPDLCGSCKNRGLTLRLNNDTSVQESIAIFFCKVIPELVFSNDLQEAVDTVDITEPAGCILDVNSFITNCTEYEKVPRIIILSATYDVPSQNMTVEYKVLGLDAADTVEFWINEETSAYDTDAIAVDGTYTNTTTLPSPLAGGDYRVYVKLTTADVRSQFLPIRVCESVVLLALDYEHYYTQLTISYSQFDTTETDAMEIWMDGVLFDTVNPVLNGENQSYIDTDGLTSGSHEFWLVDLASGYESNHLTIIIPPVT